MTRAAGVAIVHTDSPDYPAIGDAAGAVSYARLLRAREEEPTGYTRAEIDRWCATAKDWAAGRTPDAFPLAAPEASVPATSRDVFVFYINGAKVRAPQAAMAMIERLDG